MLHTFTTFDKTFLLGVDWIFFFVKKNSWRLKALSSCLTVDSLLLLFCALLLLIFRRQRFERLLSSRDCGTRRCRDEHRAHFTSISIRFFSAKFKLESRCNFSDTTISPRWRRCSGRVRTGAWACRPSICVCLIAHGWRNAPLTCGLLTPALTTVRRIWYLLNCGSFKNWLKKKTF